MTAILLLLGLMQAKATYRFHDGVALNDLRTTPGVIAIHDASKVCSTKWGKDERHVTEAMKNRVYVLYSIDKKQVRADLCGPRVKCDKRVKVLYEQDHVISRELGGADDERNLFPQPYFAYPGAHAKDKLENWAHKQVCKAPAAERDKLLSQFQQQIAADWYSLYLRMEGGK